MTINVLINLLCLLTKMNVSETCALQIKFHSLPQGSASGRGVTVSEVSAGMAKHPCFFCTSRVKAAAKYWEGNKSLYLSPPPKVRIARSIFFLFYMKHRKNTSETFSGTGTYMQSIKLEYFKILSLRTKPHQREEVDSQLPSLRASWSPAFSYSFRRAAGSKCQD